MGFCSVLGIVVGIGDILVNKIDIVVVNVFIYGFCGFVRKFF